MEIYPIRQLQLLSLSFLWGAMGVVLLWLLSAARVLIGAYRPPSRWEALYARELPLLHRAPRIRSGRVGAFLTRACVVACDVVFCVVMAVGEILLLYEYNDGAMRPIAPVCALVGLALAQRLTVRVASAATAYLGYAIAVLRAYLAALLLLPCRLAVWLGKMLLRPLRALWSRIVACYLAKRSAALCRAQLASAKCGLATKEIKK